MIKLSGRCGITHADRVVAIERAGNSESLGNVCGQTVERDVQSISLEFRRKETAGEVPGEIDPFLDVLHNFVGLGHLGCRPTSEFLAQDLGSERRPGQMLAETIM